MTWQIDRRIRVRAAFVLAVLPVALGSANASGWSDDKTMRLADRVAPYHKAYRPDGFPRAPAISVAVGIDGELAIAEGYGEAETGKRATAWTVYNIGSVSKQMTAAAVLSLIERGARAPISQRRLALNTPLTDLIEGVDHWSKPGDSPLTLRNLLTMTSNLPNYTRKPPVATDPWGAIGAAQLLGELRKLSPNGFPNSYEYSNTNYFLLAQIIEAVVGRTSGNAADHRGYMRTAVFAKAGMTDTSFVGSTARSGHLAEPHFRRRPAFTPPDWLKGSGDIASTAVDIFRWNDALMEGRILDPDMRETMFADAAHVSPLEWYGMGWFIGHDGDVDQFGHSGTVPGYTSYNLIVRKRAKGSWVSVTLLTNSDGVEGLPELAFSIADLAME